MSPLVTASIVLYGGIWAGLMSSVSDFSIACDIYGTYGQLVFMSTLVTDIKEFWASSRSQFCLWCLAGVR